MRGYVGYHNGVRSKYDRPYAVFLLPKFFGGFMSKRVTQRHHISYQPEWIVPIYKGEHWCLTQMQRRVNVSVGFLTSLKVFIAQHEHTAHDLEAIPEIK
jgi:hypothetical protein